MKKLISTISLASFIAISSFNASAVNPLDALNSIISSATSTSNFQLSDIVGTWEYQSPAVSFKSDDALSKIGGVAASTSIENKLASYYKTAGINTMVLTVKEDNSFSMKIKSVNLSGTIAKDGDGGNLIFNFNAFGRISIGKIAARAEKSANNTLSITFDVSKVMTVVEKVGDIAKVQSLQAITSLLKSYDGLFAGARMKKTSTASSNSSTSTSGSSNSTSSKLDALKSILKK